jgi:hypothetical protein
MEELHAKLKNEGNQDTNLCNDSLSALWDNGQAKNSIQYAKEHTHTKTGLNILININ